MNYPLLVDASWYQGDIDPQQVIAAGAHGVILKASELLRVKGPIDPQFVRNRAACEAAGLMVAAYGFLDPADGIPQADLLYQIAGANIILALDLEAAGVTLKEAEDFVVELHRPTGRWPLVYTADYVLTRIAGHSSPVLAQCPLWLCAIGTDAPIVPKPWTSWVIHQYGYINLGAKTFDADHFNGTLDELKRFFAVSDILKDEALQATVDIPAFKTPGGDLHSWCKVGDIATLNQSTRQVVNGVTYLQATDDRWFRAEQLGEVPDQPPAATPVVRYVDPGDVLNIRQDTTVDGEGNPTGKVLGKIKAGTKVEVFLPPDNSKYAWVKTAKVNGVPMTAYVSSTFLTDTAPK